MLGGGFLQKYIAHVKSNPDGSWSEPQDLYEHLAGTAELAADFSKKFSSQEWGYVLGLAHDLGKARMRWQKYLGTKSGYDQEAHIENLSGKEKHSIYGAKVLEKIYPQAIARALAYVIAGHHAGLPDYYPSDEIGKDSLVYQLSQTLDLTEIPHNFIEPLLTNKIKNPPWRFGSGMEFSMWVRMLYSALVDADFLNTEEYMNEKHSSNRGSYKSIDELFDLLQQHNLELESNSAETKVNRVRKNVRSKCLEKADLKQGVYTLSVPTGGGKTLSSMAFALAHARKHFLDRVIYVIPYTSIIEQNAEVFRNVFGSEQVIEHHSNVNEDDVTSKSRLATENWDAPIIVTTTVQFFESLFANRSSSCRKLHNVANSVIVLDEAQLLPVQYLAPILEAMQILTDQYKVSFLITTATQPAFSKKIGFLDDFPYLKNVSEIIGGSIEVADLYQSLKRVCIKMPMSFDETTEYEDIALKLQEYEQVLCIVSDRKSCRELHALMPEDTFHLSAMMCPEHRSVMITQIKEKLERGDTVRVISTQLIEAGVDVDFPVVYRAFAGLDSIIQAAGRCNREGKHKEGKVVVFIPKRKPPMGVLRKASDCSKEILTGNPNLDLTPEIFNDFFSKLYWHANSLDEKSIRQDLSIRGNEKELAICFKTASEKFRIIENSQVAIYVPYIEGRGLIIELEQFGPSRDRLRKLQRFTVNIYHQEFQLMLNRGSIKEIYPGFYSLVAEGDYSEKIGLLIEPLFDPEKFVM